MKVLLIGSGGREHALAWSLAASPRLSKLICAPGNGGMASLAECVPLDAADHAAVLALCRARAIDLVVIGPEAPLVAGLADDLRAQGIKVFGPSKAAARLEGSKGFTKDLCREAGIPTADYGRFADARSAKAYVTAVGRLPIVVKADGLAAGKGVVVAATREEAERAIDACFAGAFGAAGSEVVIEDFLEGEEVSFFALCDGETVLPLATAQDHKRVLDGDRGPNTGGMGAYSPAPVVTTEIHDRIMREIIRPTVAALARRGTPFQGVLFAGIMITADGPKIYEYNCRFGDPECQVLMMRLKSDLLTALLATVEGALATVDLTWREEAALTVVMAAKGYPGSYQTGSEIRGLAEAAAVPGARIFHAGTRREGNRIIATGGRVLSIAGLGRTVGEAQATAYAAVDRIDWPEGFCRRDIGWRAIARERQA
jgi:phosphoribosylamine--glycine ligase